jgi:hypothetical protein
MSLRTNFYNSSSRQEESRTALLFAQKPVCSHRTFLITLNTNDATRAEESLVPSQIVRYEVYGSVRQSRNGRHKVHVTCRILEGVWRDGRLQVALYQTHCSSRRRRSGTSVLGRPSRGARLGLKMHVNFDIHRGYMNSPTDIERLPNLIREESLETSWQLVLNRFCRYLHWFCAHRTSG